MGIKHRTIRHLRRARGWTQTDLAKRAGISRVQVTRIETGVQGTSIATLRRLARALKVEVGALL